MCVFYKNYALFKCSLASDMFISVKVCSETMINKTSRGIKNLKSFFSSLQRIVVYMLDMFQIQEKYLSLNLKIYIYKNCYVFYNFS